MVALLVVAVTGAGCGASTPAAKTPAPSTSTTTVVQPGPSVSVTTTIPSQTTATTSAPTATNPLTVPPPAVPPQMVADAQSFLAQRENAIGFNQPSATAWVTAVQPLMTPAGWAALSKSTADGNPGIAYTTAHQQQLTVKATATCAVDRDPGPPTATFTELSCSVTDQTLQANGQPLPVDQIPQPWPYQGPQVPARLAMGNVNGQWLVDADQTGLAG